RAGRSVRGAVGGPGRGRDGGRAGHARAPLRLVGRPGRVPARRRRRRGGGGGAGRGLCGPRAGAGPMTAGWGMTWRLARREARRRPGRTALVAVLIGLPVAAFTAGLIMVRTVNPTPADRRVAERGHA